MNGILEEQSVRAQSAFPNTAARRAGVSVGGFITPKHEIKK